LAGFLGAHLHRGDPSQPSGWSRGRRSDEALLVAGERRGADQRERGVHFLAAWLAEGLDSWISLRLLGVRVSYANVLSFDSLVSLIRSLAFFLPGALGVQELSYMAFLRTFGIGDDTNLLMAFVLLKRAKEVFWIVTGCANRTVTMRLVSQSWP
jgi:glycosyltransferase 2 family protein